MRYVPFYLYTRVLNHFNGDMEKTNIWFRTKNAAFGGSSATSLARSGRIDTIDRVITSMMQGGLL